MFSDIYHHPLTQLCVSQAAGLGGAFLVDTTPIHDIAPINAPESVLLAGIAGVFASAMSMIVFRVPWWWWCINLMFPGAILFALTVDLSAWIYLAGFLVLLVVFRNAVGAQVPLYLSNRKAAMAVTDIVPRVGTAQVIDIGSGIGGLLRDAARCRTDCTFTGVENAPVPYLFSLVRSWWWRLPNLSFRYGSFWSVDLGPYDLVYCFLSPAPMARLYEKAKREMKQGAAFVSNSFPVPGVPPDKVITVDDKRRTKLLIWYM